jgi:flagellar motor switch protein FliN
MQAGGNIQMSDMVAVDPREPAAFVQMWAQILDQVLGEITGAPLPAVVLPETPAELTPPSDSDLWIIVTCAGSIRGEMSLRLPAATTVRMAQIFMTEPAAPADVTPEHREAVVELLRQVGGLAATAIKSTWGEVQLHVNASSSAPSWTVSSSSCLRVGEASGALLEFQISAALAATLRAEKVEAETLTPQAKATAPPSPADAPPPSSPLDDKINLNLLLDVELAVTLRFGSRSLPLREILDLNPGAVIDLDRRVQEPVDMLLDGRIIARGEVVVVDGNYGLRVTEIGPATA